MNFVAIANVCRYLVHLVTVVLVVNDELALATRVIVHQGIIREKFTNVLWPRVETGARSSQLAARTCIHLYVATSLVPHPLSGSWQSKLILSRR